MRGSYRGAAFVASCAGVLALVAAGCAAISGLNDITEQECAPDCGVDGGTAPPHPDATMSNDAPANPNDTGSVTDDSPTSNDTGSVVEAGGGSETGTEADGGEDDASIADASDAGIVDAGPVDTGPPDTGPGKPDASCGPTTTITNCSACGDQCATNTGAPACTGSTCNYTCSANRIDCNFATAPNLDGCECSAPTGTACCGTGCPIAHTYDSKLDASVATYYACVADGTYNVTTATTACAAYTGAVTQCNDLSTFECEFADGGNAGNLVCANGSTKPCACWGYDGVVAGTMTIGTKPGDNNCPCPQLGSPTWN